MIHLAALPPGAVLADVLGDLREVAGQAALLLLVGGLAMLSFIILLVVLQNLFPDRSPDPSSATAGRELRPVAGAPSPQQAQPAKKPPRAAFGRSGAFLPEEPINVALGRIVERHLGEPRVLRARDRLTHLRMYGCRDCEQVAPPAPDHVCNRQVAALAAVFQGIHGPQARVRETACHARGERACEFEVLH